MNTWGECQEAPRGLPTYSQRRRAVSGRTRRRLLRGLVALSTLGATLFSGGPVQATEVIAGACYLVIDIDYSPAAELLPQETTLTFGGGGTCVVSDLQTVHAASISGSATTPLGGQENFACAGGIAVGGQLTLTIWDLTDPNFSGKAHVVATAAALVIAIVDQHKVPELLAAGVFVRAPIDAETCATSSLATTTWIGALVFEDPVLLETPH
jgi:hypothetical protein